MHINDYSELVFDSDEEKQARDIFRSVVQGSNFLTPYIFRYEKINETSALEYTHSNEGAETLYGITVVLDGVKSDELSKCFNAPRHAEAYICELKEEYK